MIVNSLFPPPGFAALGFAAVVLALPPLVGCAGGDTELRAEPSAAWDNPSQAWAAAAALPEARTEVSVTTDGARIYLAGGFVPAAGGSGADAPRTMWVYDPVTDGWTDAGPIPEGVNHAGFVHHEGRLYLVGGFRESSFVPIANVRIYDISAGAWSEGPPLPTPRGALATVVLNGRIHAIGGNVAGPDAVHDHEGAGLTSDRSVAVHEVLDLSTGEWSRLAPMPTARNHLGAAAIGGRVHVVGGRADGNFEMTTHEVYDAGSNSWETAAPVPTGRSGIAVVAAGGMLYMFGGETFGGGARTFAEAERFDPATGEWQRLPPMPTARHGLGAAAVGDWVHVVSGGPSPGFSYGTYHERFGPVGGPDGSR